jgi:hypothetical protein
VLGLHVVCFWFHGRLVELATGSRFTAATITTADYDGSDEDDGRDGGADGDI